MRLGGDPQAATALRFQIDAELHRAGHAVEGVALDLDGAAAEVGCAATEAACVGQVAAWVGRSVAVRAVIVGEVAADDSGDRTWIEIVDPTTRARLRRLEATPTADDWILLYGLARAIAAAIVELDHPPPPPTEEESAILAGLDELAPSGAYWHPPPPRRPPPPPRSIGVDLHRDFKHYCRARTRRELRARGEPIEPTPYCRNGPFWGYFRPPTWTLFGVALAGTVATATLYGIGLAEGDDEARRRRALIGGHVALGVTLVAAAVWVRLLFLDRRDARRFILRDKRLRSVEIQPAGMGVFARF